MVKQIIGVSFVPNPNPPTPVGHLRIVPNGSASAYIITPHAMGAIAYELTLGNGADESTPPSSIGAPFGGWRWTGTHHLAAVTDDPTAPIATMHQDIGSVDSAMQANFGASLFGGHYHGGIVLASSDMPDLTTERYVSSFSFGYAATITWPTGETADVVYTLSIGADGNLAGSMTYDSEAVFTRAFLSMMIGNAFTHYSADGETWTDARGAGSYPLGSAAGVIMRQGDSGYEIEVQTVGQDALTGVTNEIVNNGGRLKHYVRKTSAGGPLGAISLARTIAFRKTEPDPPPENLFHWVGAEDGETWLEVPASAAVYLDAGNCVLERGTHTGVAYHRAIWEMAGLEPETAYRLPISATAEGSDSAGCWIDIILSSNGSTTGARASDFLKDAIDRGYIDFTTDVGQTTLYAMIRQRPLVDSVEVARVSELGPLEVAP